MPVEQAAERPELPVDDTYAAAREAYAEVSNKAPDTPVDTPAAPEKPTIEAVKEAEPAKIIENRDPETGRFIEKTEPTEAKPEKVADVKPTEVKAPEIKPPEQPTQTKVEQAAQLTATTAAPPGGWSPKSKSEWEKLPEHIRADIAKREQEVAEGFSQYEGMRPLRRYVEMARQNGLSLEAVLDNYTGLETLLRQDPQRGFLQIAANLGIRPEQMAAAFAPYLGQQPTQTGQAEQSGSQTLDPSVLQQWFNPLAQEITNIKQFFAQQQQATHNRELGAVNGIIARFSADPANRYYQNVEPLMLQLIQGGVVPRTGDYAADLKTAYLLACRMDPDVHEAMMNDRLAQIDGANRQSEQAAAEKARLASRSITGSPGGGTSREDDGLGDSVEADTRRAVRAHSAGV